MKRRHIVGFAVSVALLPKASLAQSPRVRRVVLLGVTPFGSAQHLFNAFEQGMREHGIARDAM